MRIHLIKQPGSRIRSQDVERRSRNSHLNCPVDSATEYIAVVSIQSKDKTAIDHDSKTIQSANDFAIIATKILSFAGVLECISGKSFEANEKTAETGGSCFFD